MMHRGKPIKGLVQIIDDRPGEGDDTWLLADEDELWPYYEESRPVEESEE